MPSINRRLFEVLHATGKFLSFSYYTIFGSLDRSLAKGQDAALGADIERDWSILLSEHHGRITAHLPERTRTNFDYAICNLLFSDLAVQVVRGRGEVRVQVSAPDVIEKEWVDLPMILIRLGLPQLRADEGLHVFGQSLRSNWTAVVEYIRAANS